jgi:CRISPR/Cas system CMR-associated protein Cmr1 (group 7 of RAMP superfamily)
MSSEVNEHDADWRAAYADGIKRMKLQKKLETHVVGRSWTRGGVERQGRRRCSAARGGLPWWRRLSGRNET